MSEESYSSLFDETEERPDSRNSMFDEAEELPDSPNSLFDEPEELSAAAETLEPAIVNPADFLINFAPKPANDNEPFMGFEALEAVRQQQEDFPNGTFPNEFAAQYTEYPVDDFEQNMADYNQQFAITSEDAGASLGQPLSGTDETLGDLNNPFYFQNDLLDAPMAIDSSNFDFLGHESQHAVAPPADLSHGTGAFGILGRPSEVSNPYLSPAPEQVAQQGLPRTLVSPESAWQASHPSSPPVLFPVPEHVQRQGLSGTYLGPESVYLTPPTSFTTSPTMPGVPRPAVTTLRIPPPRAIPIQHVFGFPPAAVTNQHVNAPVVNPPQVNPHRPARHADLTPRIPITKTMGAGITKEPKKRGRPPGSHTKTAKQDAKGKMIFEIAEVNVPDNHQNVVTHLRLRQGGTRQGRSQILHLGGQ